jgi:signal transduction histidine kinase
MREKCLEPGILRIFKLYIAMRLGLILSSAIFYFLWYRADPDLNIAPYVTLFVADLIFLFVFLGWPWLQRCLGRIHLPIALTVATLIPIAEGPYLSELYTWQSISGFWLVFPFLLVPLILTAWQYRFRYVVLYTLGTLLLELFLRHSSVYLGTEDLPAQINLLMLRTLLLLLIGYIVSDLVTAQRQQRRELAAANQKLVLYAVTLERLTISRERNRLARELHDTLAHTLSGLAVQLDAILTVWPNTPPKADAMLRRALDTTRHGLAETRRALHDLRATPLEDLGLSLAIRTLAENVAARCGLELTLDISDQLKELPPEVEQCYYRVAQEALDNVARHADASQLEVSLKRRDGDLVLRVADDGTGFANGDDASQNGFGLRGMRERAELIGGTLEVESRSGEGTTILLRSEVKA